jgi:hypothetical protein
VTLNYSDANDRHDTGRPEVAALYLPVAEVVRLLALGLQEGAFQLSIPVEWKLNLAIGVVYKSQFGVEVEVEALVETKGHRQIHPALVPNAPNQRVFLGPTPRDPLEPHWY